MRIWSISTQQHAEIKSADACSPQNISGASQQSEMFATAAPTTPTDTYFHFYLRSFSEDFGLKRVIFFHINLGSSG